MMPTRKYYNQNWLPSIFNDFFDNNWMEKSKRYRTCNQCGGKRQGLQSRSSRSGND